MTLVEQSAVCQHLYYHFSYHIVIIANAEDGVLSRRLASTYPISAVILKNTDNADTASYCCDAVSMLSAFLGQLFQWTPLSKAPGSATGTGMLTAMGEVHHMNM